MEGQEKTLNYSASACFFFLTSFEELQADLEVWLTGIHRRGGGEYR
jgi:hypothetical protein